MNANLNILSSMRNTLRKRELTWTPSRSHTFSGEIPNTKRGDAVEPRLSLDQPSQPARLSTINVVLFGETGVGKSSVINLIARKPIAKVSSDVNGCTMQSTPYEIPFGGMNFVIYDTIGLEEPQIAVNGYFKAIEKAYQLIETLSAAGGIHLLLFCMRGGRITATTQSNYRLFHEALCSKSVPMALVFTGLEREVEMEDWWGRNEKHISDYGIKSNGHACITAVQDDTPGEDLKYTESQGKIRELLTTCALKNDPFMLEKDTWLARLGHFMRNFIKKHKVPAKKDMMRVLTKRCKLDPETAKRIVEMMEKTGAKSEDSQATNDNAEISTDPPGQVDESKLEDEETHDGGPTDEPDENVSGTAGNRDREGSQTPTGQPSNIQGRSVLPEGGGYSSPMGSGNNAYHSQGLGEQASEELDKHESSSAHSADTGNTDETAGYQTPYQGDTEDEQWVQVRGNLKGESRVVQGSQESRPADKTVGYQTHRAVAIVGPPAGWENGSRAIQGIQAADKAVGYQTSYQGINKDEPTAGGESGSRGNQRNQPTNKTAGDQTAHQGVNKDELPAGGENRSRAIQGIRPADKAVGYQTTHQSVNKDELPVGGESGSRAIQGIRPADKTAGYQTTHQGVNKDELPAGGESGSRAIQGIRSTDKTIGYQTTHQGINKDELPGGGESGSRVISANQAFRPANETVGHHIAHQGVTVTEIRSESPAKGVSGSQAIQRSTKSGAPSNAVSNSGQAESLAAASNMKQKPGAPKPPVVTESRLRRAAMSAPSYSTAKV